MNDILLKNLPDGPIPSTVYQIFDTLHRKRCSYQVWNLFS